MAIKRCESSIDVVKAAKIRIRNVFQNGLPVYMSFSGGKDSLCMAQLAERYRNFFMSVSAIADNKDCKAIYEGLISGDPKLRSYRALYQRIYGKYITEAKKKEGMTNG